MKATSQTVPVVAGTEILLIVQPVTQREASPQQHLLCVSEWNRPNTLQNKYIDVWVSRSGPGPSIKTAVCVIATSPLVLIKQVEIQGGGATCSHWWSCFSSYCLVFNWPRYLDILTRKKTGSLFKTGTAFSPHHMAQLAPAQHPAYGIAF